VILMRLIKEKSGFTLIELLIVTALLTLILSAVAYTFIYATRYSSVARVRLTLQKDIGATLQYLSRTIRLAGIRPVDVGFEDIGENSLTFQSDSNGDGVTERFRFWFDANGNTIYLSKWIKSGGIFVEDGTPQVVMENVQELSFSYYTVDNVETTNPAEVTSVEIRLTLVPPPSVHQSVREIIGSLKGSTLTYCPNLAWRLN